MCVQYMGGGGGGNHEYIGDIMSTSGDVQYIGRYHEYIGGGGGGVS